MMEKHDDQYDRRKMTAAIKSAMIVSGVKDDEMAIHLRCCVETFRKKLKDPYLFSIGDIKKMKQKIVLQLEV